MDLSEPTGEFFREVSSKERWTRVPPIKCCSWRDDLDGKSDGGCSALPNRRLVLYPSSHSSDELNGEGDTESGSDAEGIGLGKGGKEGFADELRTHPSTGVHDGEAKGALFGRRR
jgi:hypothetical protein